MQIFNVISPEAKIGKNTKIWHFTQVREKAEIGANCIIGKNCYIDSEVRIGNNVKIQNNVSIYKKAIIEDGVFIGPHVCFTNDKIPRAITINGELKTSCDWKASTIVVKKGASIGANSTILPDVSIGEFALVGAGSVVSKDVPAFGLVFGNPARLKGFICKCGKTRVNADAEELICDVCQTSVKLK